MARLFGLELTSLNEFFSVLSTGLHGWICIAKLRVKRHWVGVFALSGRLQMVGQRLIPVYLSLGLGKEGSEWVVHYIHLVAYMNGRTIKKHCREIRL